MYKKILSFLLLFKSNLWSFFVNGKKGDALTLEIDKRVRHFVQENATGHFRQFGSYEEMIKRIREEGRMALRTRVAKQVGNTRVLSK